VNDDHPSHGEQELEDQLTQEQFDNELEKGLEVMFTQEELVEDEDPVGEPREEKAERMPKAKKGMMMRMTTAHMGDM
jgi:hypothetical protein